MRCIFDVRSGILKVESDLWFVGECAFGMRVSFDFLGETSFFRLPFRGFYRVFIGTKCFRFKVFPNILLIH